MHGELHRAGERARGLRGDLRPRAGIRRFQRSPIGLFDEHGAPRGRADAAEVDRDEPAGIGLDPRAELRGRHPRDRAVRILRAKQ